MKTPKELFIDYLSKKGLIRKRQLHPDIEKAFDIAIKAEGLRKAKEIFKDLEVCMRFPIKERWKHFEDRKQKHTEGK